MGSKKQRTDENKISISRRRVLQATGTVAIGATALSGTASANCPCTGVTLGKIEEEDLPACGETTTVTLTLNGDQRIANDPECQGDKEVDVLVTATECKDDDNEVTCVELKIIDDNGACKCGDDGLYLNGASVKGGPTSVEYDCEDVASVNQEYSKIPNACAPTNSRNGKRFGISNIVIEVCVFPNDKQTGGKCAKGGGG